MKTEGSGVMRLAMAFVLGLGEHWHGETPRWRSPGLGFLPPSPLLFSPFPCPCSWRRCMQGAAGQPRKWTWGPRGSHSNLVGNAEGPGAQRASAWGLCKDKELKKKKKSERWGYPEPAGGQETVGCGPGAAEWFGGERDFFLLLMGIVMVLSYFTGGVNIACYPVYLLKISV